MKGIFKYCLFLFLISSILSTSPAIAADSAKVLKLGTINPLSGASALWGRIVTEQTLIPMVEMINHKGGVSVGGEKYKLELISEDDKATAAGGRAAAEQLIFNDKVKSMVGNLLPASILAMAPLATEQKIITIVGSGSVFVKSVMRCTA